MKKVITLVLVMVLVLSSFGMVAEARVGDVIGTALHTDIVAYINHFAIPSYIVNGTSVVVAEDLRDFGFDVEWDPYERTLNIYRNDAYYLDYLYHVDKSYSTGAKYADILSTDIRVYADGYRITSYNMNGYTMIPVEELTMFGEVVWDQYGRTLKMWVDNMEIWPSPQPVSKKYYEGTTAPDFGWVTGAAAYGVDGECWSYLAGGEEVEAYKDYLETVGYRFDLNKQIDGDWVIGYINSRTKTGIGFWEEDGLVYVYTSTGIDGWE